MQGVAMIYELWESEDGTETCFTSQDSYTQQPCLKKDVDGKDMVKIWEVEADTYDDACRELYKYKGWEPYIPFDER